MIDINASIEPGKASAGFFLGQPLTEVWRRIDLSGMKTWSRAGGEQLASSIKNTADWLRVPVSEISEDNFRGEVWHYSNGMIELHFGQTGELFDISVFEGYRGSLRGGIMLGMTMAELENICPLLYDGAEEMYLSKDANNLSGVGFYMDESKSVPLLYGISVFDLSFDK